MTRLIAPNRKREIISVGVDYITATAKDRHSRTGFEILGRRLLEEEKAAGNETASFRLHELEGIRCGAVEYATSYWWDMLRLSSHLASDHWTTVAQRATNVSRLDLQVTLRLTPTHENFPEAVERALRRFKREKNTRLEIELRRNDVKGKTLYSGSRKSDRFARLYDKGRESKLPELSGCWRVEQQIQNALAWRYAQALVLTPEPSHAIYGELERYYRERGAALVPSSDRIPLELTQIPRKSAGELERTLNWLESQVAPAVARQRAAGNLDQVLRALGLSDVVEGL